MPALERTVARPRRARAASRALRETIAVYRELRDAGPGVVRRAEAEQASLAFLGEIEARVAANRSG